MEMDVVVIATFALGWDDHAPDVFDRTVDFCVDCGLTVPEFIINTPFPGSRLYKRYRDQARICSFDWNKYNGNHAVYRPLHMHPQELEEGLHRCNERFYGDVDRNKRLFDALKYRAYESMIRARKKQDDGQTLSG